MVEFAKNLPIRGNVQSGMDNILNMPKASVYFQNAQAIVTAAVLPLQAVTWDTIEFVDDGMWSVTNPNLFFIRTAGVYLCTGWIIWGANSTGYRQMMFKRTTPAGVVTQFGDLIQPPNSVNPTGQEITKLIPVNAGDAIQLYVGQNIGGNLSLTVATSLLHENGFQACLVST